MPHSPSPAPSAELIAGRYLLERRLAAGGMGEVFAALDQSSKRRVALKRLNREGLAQRSLHILFMREYHALSELRHPRIIEVYDYGSDHDAPYYTMELLDGADLSELSPVPYREACRYLRDVASSLALLHARRLLHRDLSPRNVRRTSDGRCKVLDFGTMMPFGVPANLAGTPPCVPPEALQIGPLDQRADLYSLGALAYRILTGSHAYPARDFSALPEAWERACTRPRKRVPDLPPALDELVMSLLSMDPLNRPSSAAEVIDRLCAAAALEPDDSPGIAHSFLAGSRLVARDSTCALLREQLQTAHAGRGSAVMISGASGSGRTRMLAEAARLGQSSGLSVVRAVARRTHGDAPALLSDLVLGLHQVAPLEAQRASADQPLLAQAGRNLAAHSGEMRVQLLAEVTELFKRVSRERPLLITVDDLDRADELSGALVAALAHEASATALALVAACDSSRSAPVLASVRGLASTLTLTPLDDTQTLQLVASLFGDVPQLERVSDWLFRSAGGSPKLTLELAEHLLARGIVRYVEGTWVLPAEIAEPLPHSTAAALMLRLDAVSGTARALAELLSVSRAGASAELLLELTREPEAALFSALEELVSAGVLVSAGDEYVFAQAALRKELTSALDPARRHELHRRWAESLLAQTDERDSQLEAGWHLVHTDDELRGAAILAKIGPELVAQRVKMAAAVPAIERALEVYERRGGPLAERLRLRAQLVMSGYLFDHRLAERYANDTLDGLYPFTGLPEAERLSRWIGKRAGFAFGLLWAALRWGLRRSSRRGPTVLSALIDYVRTAMGLGGLRALMADGAGTRDVLHRMRAFEGAPHPGLAVTHSLMKAIVLFNQARVTEVEEVIGGVLRQLERPQMQFSEQERIDVLGGALLLGGINECYRERSQALKYAEKLEQLGPALAKAAALRIRMTYHSLRGEYDRTLAYRRQLDLNAIHNGTHWQIDWIALPIEGFAAITWSDIVALRRSLDAMERLAHDVPAFSALRDSLRIGYAFRRGDYAGAVKLGEEYMRKRAPFSVNAWAISYAMTALSYVELGQVERAQAITESALALVSARPSKYLFLYMVLEAAHATTLALRGRREEGERRFIRLIEDLRAASEFARACFLHEYRVRVARLLGDRIALRLALEDMRRDALASQNPRVIALADRVVELNMAARSSPPPLAPQVTEPEVVMPEETVATMFLRAAPNPAQRAARALQLLVPYAGTGEAYLFLARADDLWLAASLDPTRRAPPALEAALARAPANNASYSVSVGEQPDDRYTVVPLANTETSRVAVVAVRELAGAPVEIPTALIADVSRALRASSKLG